MASKRKRSGFGSVRKLASGRFQARYTGPDGRTYNAPVTFDTIGDAETYLATVRADIVRDAWRPPHKDSEQITFGEYAITWLADRDLKPRTRAHYKALLDRHIVPTFEQAAIGTITPASVRAWYARLAEGKPTLRAHAYGLLRAILATALTDELIPANPCHIRSAGTVKRKIKIKPLSVADLEKLVTAMPAKYQVMTLLAAWCGLRFGELTELRRKDVDTKNGILHIRRGVAWVSGKPVVGTPKSVAGIRDVAIPPHLLPVVKQHLSDHAAWGKDGLLFPAPTGTHLTTSTLYASFYPARKKIGRPDLRWHDLRHTGAVLAASTGATLAELMARLGHSTPGAALRYQHAAQARDVEIAKALSKLATEAR